MCFQTPEYVPFWETKIDFFRNPGGWLFWVREYLLMWSWQSGGAKRPFWQIGGVGIIETPFHGRNVVWEVVFMIACDFQAVWHQKKYLASGNFVMTFGKILFFPTFLMPFEKLPKLLINKFPKQGFHSVNNARCARDSFVVIIPCSWKRNFSFSTPQEFGMFFFLEAILGRVSLSGGHHLYFPRQVVWRFL